MLLTQSKTQPTSQPNQPTFSFTLFFIVLSQRFCTNFEPFSCHLYLLNILYFQGIFSPDALTSSWIVWFYVMFITIPILFMSAAKFKQNLSGNNQIFHHEVYGGIYVYILILVCHKVSVAENSVGINLTSLAIVRFRSCMIIAPSLLVEVFKESWTTLLIHYPHNLYVIFCPLSSCCQGHFDVVKGHSQTNVLETTRKGTQLIC